MNHWIVVPVVLPAILAAIMTLSIRGNPALQRVLSLAGVVALLAVVIGLTVQAASGTIQVYELGNWPAPFGIVLVLDRLSALMVLLTAVLAMLVLLYAIGSGWDQRGRNFHPLYQFQLMGIFGAFLTGDLFNLFVFFEVLLIASYGLMIHSGGSRRLKAGVQYVIYNLLASTLFLFALGTIYAVTGTLNMADLAERAADIPEGDSALLRVGAMLLFLVFAVKAALLPLHFWLPETYANAPAPVAALFAIMTKVGAYAILRTYTLVFGPDLGATGDLMDQILLYGALLTLAVGMIGILGATRLGRLAAFATIGSLGTLLIAISGFNEATTAAAIYYMLHSTLAGALLFIVVDLVRERRGTDRIKPGARVAQHGLITALFFGAAIATAGLPPLSGFIGKLLVLDAVRDMQAVWLIWSVVLATSLVAVLGFAQAGSAVFWKPLPGDARPETARPEPAQTAAPPVAVPMVAACTMLGAILALSVLAGPVMRYVEATAAQLHAPAEYIAAVLNSR